MCPGHKARDDIRCNLAAVKGRDDDDSRHLLSERATIKGAVIMAPLVLRDICPSSFDVKPRSAD